MMTPYAFAVQQGGAQTAADASRGAARDKHGNAAGAEFDLTLNGALTGTSVMMLVGTHELEDLGCAGGPSPVFETFTAKGTACTKCVLHVYLHL